jgi:hypothetical protein
MVAKYAVLWDVDGKRSTPVGIAIKRGSDVVVTAPWQYGIPTRISAPYRVLLPDLTEVVYGPDDDAYFDQVLIDLSRSFAIGERGERERSDVPTITELMAEKVTAPAVAMRRGHYGAGSSGDDALSGADAPARQDAGDRLVAAVGRVDFYRPALEPPKLALAASADGHVPDVAA